MDPSWEEDARRFVELLLRYVFFGRFGRGYESKDV